MLRSPTLAKPTLISNSNNEAISSARSEKDRISLLQDDLILDIISYLNLRDVVRTSVLSRRWNQLYTFLSKLQFEWESIKPGIRNACENPCVLYKDKFVGTVNQFLKSYQGTRLCLFTVKCCLGSERTSDIDGWVRFAVGQSCKTLTLELYCDKFCSDKHKGARKIESLYVLGCEAFEGLDSSNLKHLNLVACSLGKSLTYQLTSLENLSLSYAELSPDQMNSLLPCMSNLKFLTLKNCRFPTKLRLNMLPLLEELLIRSPHGLREIESLSVNLVKFTFLCPTKVVSFNLRQAPNLNHFSYAAPCLQLHNFFSHPPELLQLKSMKAYIIGGDWVEFIPETISTFRLIRSLTLGMYDTKFYALKIISIFRAFPHLCKLRLVTSCKENFDEEMAEAGEYVPKYLWKVEITGYGGTRSQIEFAIYLLKHASALTHLIISPQLKFESSPEDHPADEALRHIITQPLQQFLTDKVQVVIQ